METVNNYKLAPTFGDSFGTGWRVMFDNFLRLFLVVIIVGIITGPPTMFQFKMNGSDMPHGPWNWNGDMKGLFSLASLGVIAAFFGLLALLYAFLVVPVFNYGSKMIFVESVRQTKPNFEWLIKGFMSNYLSIVLANLLVFALVAIGLFALIIPGIIIACRLSFVKYIVMDKKVDPIEAVEMSWKLTRGHGWTIFFMGFVSFFIVIFGLILMIVGIFPALIWISSSFASLYQAVLLEKEKPAEPEAVAA
ncbi:MAG: hypothetical protein NT092_11450 [Bacteroidia bacterium]|jgi:hypothetical protein|nr:hypothetical protein [Bacteroidia bacterium]